MFPIEVGGHWVMIDSQHGMSICEEDDGDKPFDNDSSTVKEGQACHGDTGRFMWHLGGRKKM